MMLLRGDRLRNGLRQSGANSRPPLNAETCSAPGAVRRIYSRDKSITLVPFSSSEVSGQTYAVNHFSGAGPYVPETTVYYHGDHLGSSRQMSNANAYPMWEATYLPYGQEAAVAGGSSTSVNHYKFTGKERDGESGLDYFGARYYASAHGRFVGSDPGALGIRHALNPQKWNRYSYTLNNPLKFVDPNGMEEIIVTVRTFIPSKFVFLPPVHGDGRSAGQPGTFRTEQRITIETDPAKNNGKPLVDASKKTGVSIGFGVTKEGNLTPNKVGAAKGETLNAEASQQDKNTVNVRATGNESYPNFPLPGISYEFNISVSSQGPGGNVTVGVSGSHDRFPGYEIFVERPEAENSGQTMVYSYEPPSAAFGLTLLPLFPNKGTQTELVVIPPSKKP
jgi:RHS repeat-associated protein